MVDPGARRDRRSRCPSVASSDGGLSRPPVCGHNSDLESDKVRTAALAARCKRTRVTSRRCGQPPAVPGAWVMLDLDGPGTAYG